MYYVLLYNLSSFWFPIMNTKLNDKYLFLHKNLLTSYMKENGLLLLNPHFHADCLMSGGFICKIRRQSILSIEYMDYGK